MSNVVGFVDAERCHVADVPPLVRGDDLHVNLLSPQEHMSVYARNVGRMSV